MLYIKRAEREEAMGKYVLIYYGGGGEGDIPMEKIKADWLAWFASLGDKLIDAGNPFSNSGKAVESSGVSTIENFPANGYSIISATTMEEATEMAKGCPALEHSSTGAIRVYEALPM